MNMKLGEVAVADVVAKLKEYMPARTTTINAEKADEIQIIAPAEDAYFVGRMEHFPYPPAIFVMEGPTRFHGEGPHGLLSEMQLLVYVFESDQTGPQLAIRLQRQVRAVIECLFDDAPQERTANAYDVMPTKTIPGSVFQPESKDSWQGFYVVVFTVKQQEL